MSLYFWFLGNDYNGEPSVRFEECEVIEKELIVGILEFLKNGNEETRIYIKNGGSI